jgi:hypothetical protein
MSSNAIRVVLPPPPEVATLSAQLAALALTSALERFEIAVKNRIEQGIHDDNELRQVDEMLGQIVRNVDALDHAKKECDPRVAAPISAAHALHKSLLATVKPWKDRWVALRESCDKLILGYNRAKADLARKQQAEIDRAAARQRAEAEATARAALRNGDVAAAKAVMQEAQQIVAPVIMAAAPVLDNTGSRQVWEVKVTDPVALVQAIAAGIVPLSAIWDWDLTFFKREAAKRGGLPADWTGVSAKQEDALTHKR